MKNPCYDREKKIDCPDRKGGCQVDCKKWAEYVEARDKEYEKRQAARISEEITYESASIRKINYLKGVSSRRRRRRKNSEI